MKPIAVSMGEPAGVGPEIIVKSWLARRNSAAPWFVVGDLTLLQRLAKAAGAGAQAIATPEEATASQYAEALPVLDFPLTVPPEAGKLDARNGKAVIAALDAATNACLDGRACALVTGPIQKSVLYDAGFAYPGHTEYLAAKAGATGWQGRELMLLVGGGLRVAPVSIHIPLSEVPGALSREVVLDKARILDAGLRQDFGILRPRIAIAALNPHAGEGGALGREEIEIIAPAIAALRETGIEATGPHPADTLFHKDARARYDAVLAMYHDQALIPLKTIDFYTGVNTTLGLPIVRTSPDHGTAIDIAGTGQSNPSSFLAALDLARTMAERRKAARAS